MNSRMCLADGVFKVPQHRVRGGGQKHGSTLSGALSVPRVPPRQQHCGGEGGVITGNVVPMGSVQRPLSEEEVRWAFEGVSDLGYFDDPKFKRFVSSLR
ncbi:hypothetical protein TSMEX_008041 [Taenia solium]|eukprot:TsM_000153500 transcript=TsM_000153500 gene=TsM_000153500